MVGSSEVDHLQKVGEKKTKLWWEEGPSAEKL
jgi:hypothetical protein